MTKAVIAFLVGVLLIFLVLHLIAVDSPFVRLPPSTDGIHVTPASNDRNLTIIPSEERPDTAPEPSTDEVRAAHERASAEALIDAATSEDLAIRRIIELNVLLLAHIETSAAFAHHRTLTVALHEFNGTTIHSLVCTGTRCSGLIRTSTQAQAESLGLWLTESKQLGDFIVDGTYRVFEEDAMQFVHVVLTTDPERGLPMQD